MDIHTYLTFDGTCEEALNFYAQALDGEILMLSRISGMPGGDLPPGAEVRILHGRLSLGGQVIMASDSFPGQRVSHGGFSMSLGFDMVEEARIAFEKLSAGGEVTMEFAETFWAKAFGICTDQFGVSWMVNVDKPDAPSH